MSVNKVTLAMTAVGSFFVFIILGSFGMNVLVAALCGMSLIAVNLVWTTISERKAKRHAVARELRRNAVLTGSNDVNP